ncbi:unnamed protein product [Heligmosomoides polygyrus]|uniref:Uncharacterized protein n=1 Tax=Heligmosomoides polygyrus TaxID=6339 RepID=A0A3P8CJK3_HELPZ|nr:unnamed protein product [Heligmosomoides polygyrus]
MSASLVASNSVDVPKDSRIPEQRLKKMRETDRLAQIHKVTLSPPVQLFESLFSCVRCVRNHYRLKRATAVETLLFSRILTSTSAVENAPCFIVYKALSISMDKRIKDGVTQSLLGCASAFYFYGMSWRRHECVFGHAMTCGGQPMNKSALYPSQTSLVPIHRPRRDGRLGWPGQETRTRNMVSGARDSRASSDCATRAPISMRYR